MEPGIFRYILRYSKPQQLYLSMIIWSFYPVYLLSLDLPKVIINEAIEAGYPEGTYNMPLLFWDFTIETTQITFLVILCFIYLGLVFVTGGIKYYINVYKGRLGERLLRRLRYQLYHRILRFPQPHFRKVSQGELIPMITSEVEPIGGFAGTAFADPQFMGGQLVIAIGYIMYQDWVLGLAAMAFYPVQIVVIPKLQRKVNQLAKARVQQVRKLSDHVGETVLSIREVHAHATSPFELARFTSQLGRIYWIRYEIYLRKFFIKFLNNFIDKLTPFFFLLLGGLAVIEGNLEIGALVAVLAAYKDLAAPWKELLRWYQQKEDIRIKYEQVIRQFNPDDMLELSKFSLEERDLSKLQGSLVLTNVSLEEDRDLKIIDNVTVTLPEGKHVAIVGENTSGKSELAMMMAGLISPSTGRVTMGDRDLASLPERVTGRCLSYIGPNAYLYTDTIGENIVYGLKQEPVSVPAYDMAGKKQRKKEASEAGLSGNSTDDFNADWLNIGDLGLTDREALTGRILDILAVVDLSDDVYHFGLRGTIDANERPDLAAKIIVARKTMQARLESDDFKQLVAPFHKDRYNIHASVGENLIYGLPVGQSFDMQALSSHSYVQEILEEAHLMDDFIRIGSELTEIMVELFADLPPGHEFFDRFSFIAHDDLPVYEQLVDKAKMGRDALSPEEETKILALPLQLVPGKHRLGLIDDDMQDKILQARYAFMKNLPNSLRSSIAFFDENSYNTAASIQDNILFGKLVHGQARSSERVGALIEDVLETLGLRDMVLAIGLDSSVGVGGSILTLAQRQKVMIARSLLKNPYMLIMDEATASLDSASQSKVMRNIIEARQGRGLVWILNRPKDAEHFEETLVMKDGQMQVYGAYDYLLEHNPALQVLVGAE